MACLTNSRLAQSAPQRAAAFSATGARDIAGIKFNLALSALFCTVHHALGYPIQKRGDKEIKIRIRVAAAWKSAHLRSVVSIILDLSARSRAEEISSKVRFAFVHLSPRRAKLFDGESNRDGTGKMKRGTTVFRTRLRSLRELSGISSSCFGEIEPEWGKRKKKRNFQRAIPFRASILRSCSRDGRIVESRIPRPQVAFSSRQ